MSPPPLILCLGNEVVADDAFGAVVAEALEREGEREAEVVFAPLAGLRLLDLLAHRPAALIVDTIRSGRYPAGTLRRFRAEEADVTRHLTGSHQVGLGTALRFARELGIPVPERIEVIAVEAADLETIGAPLSLAVREAVPEVVRLAEEWLSLGRPHSREETG